MAVLDFPSPIGPLRLHARDGLITALSLADGVLTDGRSSPELTAARDQLLAYFRIVPDIRPSLGAAYNGAQSRNCRRDVCNPAGRDDALWCAGQHRRFGPARSRAGLPSQPTADFDSLPSRRLIGSA